MIGSTQPGRLAEYVRRAVSGGSGDDGLIQRFGLLVWPDQSPEWKDVDCYPDTAARNAAWETFDSFDRLSPEAVCAEIVPYQTVPVLRLDRVAQGIFLEWRAELERRLRSPDLPSALESHLAKYRKLVPALALINHLADGGVGPVNEAALLRALGLAEYLETHARRAYGAGPEAEIAAAKSILAHIRKGDLSEGFTLARCLPPAVVRSDRSQPCSSWPQPSLRPRLDRCGGNAYGRQTHDPLRHQPEGTKMSKYLDRLKAKIANAPTPEAVKTDKSQPGAGQWEGSATAGCHFWQF